MASTIKSSAALDTWRAFSQGPHGVTEATSNWFSDYSMLFDGSGQIAITTILEFMEEPQNSML